MFISLVNSLDVNKFKGQDCLVPKFQFGYDFSSSFNQRLKRFFNRDLFCFRYCCGIQYIVFLRQHLLKTSFPSKQPDKRLKKTSTHGFGVGKFCCKVYHYSNQYPQISAAVGDLRSGYDFPKFYAWKNRRIEIRTYINFSDTVPQNNNL